jgi:S-adenosylmethionine/arginine decarboxylase-like enzyme
MALVHKHLIIRAEVNKPPTNPIFIEAWLLDVVSAIGMKVCKGPIAHYVDMPGNRGVTGVVIIETSHIALHVWDEPNPGLMQLDVYTCGPLNPQIIFDMIEEFDPVQVEYTYLDREKGLTDITASFA